MPRFATITGSTLLFALGLLLPGDAAGRAQDETQVIRVHELTPADREKLRLHTAQAGLFVDSVSGSGHGLLESDVIVAVGNDPVTSRAQLNDAILAARRRGESMQLTIVRAGLIRPLAARLTQPVQGPQEPVLVDLTPASARREYEQLIGIVFAELAKRAANKPVTAGPGLNEVVDEEIGRLRTGSPQDRWEAAENLAGLAEVVQRAVDALLGLLRGSDAFLRSAAAVALVDALEIDDGRVAPLVLAAGLDASLPAIKQRAAQRLGRLQRFDPDVAVSVRGALTRAAADPEPAVATTARTSLARVPAGTRTGTTAKPAPQSPGPRAQPPAAPPQTPPTQGAPAPTVTPTAPSATGVPPAPPAVPGGMSARTASIECMPPSGNRANPVGFTLAAPAVVTIWANPYEKPTWWIGVPWSSGVVANVVQGVPVVMPPGSVPAKGIVALPAGTYVLNAACPASGFGSASVRVTYPGLAEPQGQRYTVTTTAESDRAYLLTEAQTVRFLRMPTTGAIWSFPGTLLWSRDGRRIEPWSTLEQLPSAYCLHGEEPNGSPGLKTALEIYGPSRPPGRVTTLTAMADGNAYVNGVESGRGVQFSLAVPQLVTVRARTGWILDADGNLWFNIVNGDVQSGSSWVEPAVGRKPGEVSLGPGALLPAGTYHFAVSSESGSRATGQIDFVGTELKEFPWPAGQRSPCFPNQPVNVPRPASHVPPSSPPPPKPANPTTTTKVPGPQFPASPPLDPGAQYSLWTYGASNESDGRQCVRFSSSSGRGTPARLEQVKQQLNERASQRCASGDKAACAGYSYVVTPSGGEPPPRDVCTKVKLWWSFEGLFGWGGGRSMYDFRASAFQSEMRADLQSRCAASPKAQACRQGATLVFQVTAEDAPRPTGCPVPPCR